MNLTVKLIQSLFRELCHAKSAQKFEDNKMFRNIMEQAKAQKETSEVLCKAQTEFNYIAELYLTDLQSLCKFKYCSSRLNFDYNFY